MTRVKILFLFVILFASPSYCDNKSLSFIDEDSLSVLHETAFNHASKGDYAQAIGIEQKIVNYFQGKPICQDYIFSLYNLAAFYSDFGDFEKALKIGNETIKYINDSIEISIEGRYEIFQHQAIYYENIGNHEKSQEYGLIALNIAKEMPLKTWAYPKSLVFLAYSYSELGDYDNAIKLCLEAKNIYNSFDDKPNSYGYVFNDLGAYYCEKGDIGKALDYGWAYINYLEEKMISDKQRYVVALNNLARYYAINKDNQRAIELSAQAWSVIESNQLSNKYLKGRTMSHLATFHANINEYEEAMKYSRNSISYFKEVWSRERPGMINQYRKHFDYSLSASDIIDCEKEILEVTKNISDIVLAAFSFLPNSGRHIYWGKYSSWYKKELPIYTYTIQTDSLTSYSYNSTLLSKGILLNSEIEIKQLILSTNDSIFIRKFNELQNLYLTLFNSNKVNKSDSIIDYLKKQESYLISSCKKYGDYTKQLNVNWQNIQKQLQNTDIAIEFISFPINNDSIMYCALTLKKEYDVPHMIPLFEAKQLSKILPKNYYTSTAISQLVWKPLEKELSGVNNIYFAPDGELYNIAIESLRHFNDKGYLFDKWNFYRVSSTRELVKVRRKKNNPNVVLYGGLDYDANVSDTISHVIDDYSLYTSTRSILDSIGLNRGYGPLTATLPEVLQIDSLYSTVNIPSTLYVGQDGTESSFKQLSGKGISNLHIATHGFYWKESELKNNSDLRNFSFITGDNQPIHIEDKAMTRSGLLFSGANAILSGDTITDCHEDGILTAQEISILDFRGLDLLVLSACQTGLGEIKGDGVFGLQRGFKKAGAQTIIMSLWNVDDNATQMLMTEFYKNLISGLSKRESFIKAQNAVRNFKGIINGESRDFSNPKYWAAFIMLDGID